MAAGAGLGLITAAHFIRMVFVILVIPVMARLAQRSRIYDVAFRKRRVD